MESSLSLPNRNKAKWMALGVGLLAVSGIGFFVWQAVSSNRVHVPQDVASAAKSKLYIPTVLPAHYEVDESSFSTQEDVVVIFSAKNTAGSRIVFTEQAKPSGFNFDDFYKNEMEESKTLSDVPFPSVFGKTHNKETTMISIVTPETWVLVTTSSPLTEDDARLIAKHLTQY